MNLGDLFARICGALTAVVLLLAPLAAAPLEAAEGDGPEHAVELKGATELTIPAGSEFWVYVNHSGRGRPIGITMEYLDVDPGRRKQVKAEVLERTVRRVSQGQNNTVRRGYTVLGELTTTSNTGPSKRFWMSRPIEARTYYVRVQNSSAKDATVRLTAENRLHPAGVY